MKVKTPLLGVRITGGLEEEMTSWAGISPLIEVGRQSGVIKAAGIMLPEKRSLKGLTPGQMVESFVALSALGGGCPEDMERLRQDTGLAAILGYTPPASETARQWLDKFHEEALMLNRPLQGSFLPPESKALAGLREVNRQTIWAYVKAVLPPIGMIADGKLPSLVIGESDAKAPLGSWVTLDIDAHLVETHKAGALYCYDGYKAYQPLIVVWAETGLVLAEEFREGNVPASKDIKRLADVAYSMLPPGLWRVRIRSDAAAYKQDTLDHWHQNHWQFAVSADMTPQLRGEIEALPPEAWQAWKEEKDKKAHVIREWAEVAYIPSKKNEKKESEPYRYMAIRIRPRQGELFGDGSSVRYYAVVSNIWDMEGQALLEWQRGKAGTVEQVHDILKNELGAGVYPSAKHGANAAWLRLQVITHNLIQLLKKVALPEEYATAKPKRLRFAIFTQFGRIIRHAGQVLLRISNQAWRALIGPAHYRITGMVWDSG